MFEQEECDVGTSDILYLQQPLCQLRQSAIIIKWKHELLDKTKLEKNGYNLNGCIQMFNSVNKA